MKRLRLGYTPRYTLLQGSYWASYCTIVAFSSVYLLARGFTNGQIGLLIGVAGVLSALLQPVISRAADGLKVLSLRQFTAWVVAVQLGASVFLLLLRGSAAQAVLYGLAVIALQLVMPLTSALGMDCLNRGHSLNFGAARGAGSVAFGVCSSLCGQLVLWFGEDCLPVAMGGMNALLLVSVLLFRYGGARKVEEEPLQEAETPKDRRPFPLQYRRCLPVLVGVVCLFISHNVLNTFPYQIIQPLGGDSGQMGTMLLIQSLVELPVMFLFSWLLTKGSSRTWVKLSGVGFFLHALGALLAPNMGVMDAVQIFEMPGYALYALASVYWVNETVQPGQRVQGQAWFTMAITLGSVLASLLGGFLLDQGGAQAILLFAVLTGGVGMVLLLALLGKHSPTMTPRTSPLPESPATLSRKD
jgi:PPP family 3-phenylpropionic acid transporter